MAKKKIVKDVEAEEKVTKKTKKVEEAEVLETEVEELEVEEKEDYEEVKEEKKKTKEDKKKEKEAKKKEKETKKNVDKKDGYVKSVGRELKKVVWPSAGDIAKYSVAVIIFCIGLVLFFLAVDALASFIKGLF